MPRHSHFACLLAVFVLFLAGCGDEPEMPASPKVQADGPQPQCVIQQTEHDFGSMLVGDTIKYRFPIENQGEGELRLQTGRPTCKCTTFELGKSVLKRGESTELIVAIEGKRADKNFSHGGPIYTNDINAQEVQFRLRGIVSVPVLVSPPQKWVVDADDVPEEGLISGFLVTRVFDEMTIKSIECQNTKLNLEWQRATDEQMTEQDWEKATSAVAIILKVDPDLSPMLIREPVTIHIDQHHKPIFLEIELRKRGPIKVIPTPGGRNYQWHELQQELQMGEFSRNTERTAALQLLVDHSEFKEALQLTQIEASPRFVKVKLDDGKPLGRDKRRYTLKITIPAGFPASARGLENPGLLQIKTNHPSGQQFDLQLTFRTF